MRNTLKNSITFQEAFAIMSSYQEFKDDITDQRWGKLHCYDKKDLNNIILNKTPSFNKTKENIVKFNQKYSTSKLYWTCTSCKVFNKKLVLSKFLECKNCDARCHESCNLSSTSSEWICDICAEISGDNEYEGEEVEEIAVIHVN